MPQYKLYYFDIRGLAEPIRLAFAQAGIEFEDVRIKREEWPNLKATMPFGQVPVLEVDGKRLTQSMAILRYIAKKHGLEADNEWDRAVGDELATSWLDMTGHFYGLFSESDPETRKEKFNETIDEFVKPRSTIFNEHLSKSTSGFLAGDKVTWCDFSVYNYLRMVKEFIGVSLSEWPYLEKYLNKIESLPKVKKWHNEHPNVPFTWFSSPLEVDYKKMKEEFKSKKP